MQLNKTGIDSGKTVELAAKTVHQAKTQSSVNTKIIETQAARSITALIKSVGLPQDKLSASVLSFARFFSLALKPEQLAAIRRQAFVQQSNAQNAGTQTAQQTTATSANQTASAMQAREVAALAAAAAESKGVELQPKGMELYTEAVDPDSHKRQDGEKDSKKQKNKNQNEQEEKAGINAVNIKKLALETAENNPVLAIMNKLPSKEGQRWIVLPFEFSQDGKNILVSMRVLMDRDIAVFMAMDINEQLTMSNEQLAISNENRQSFALEFNSNKVSKLVYYTTENKTTNKEQVKKELAKIFELPIENVFVKIGDSLPEADYGEELLKFIDEAC